MDAGHRKAVSYVRWLSDTEVVSASTDSTLRLWDIHSARESRTFRGHVNEKNFVGLAADSEFIACGSETNEVRLWSLLSSSAGLKENGTPQSASCGYMAPFVSPCTRSWTSQPWHVKLLHTRSVAGSALPKVSKQILFMCELRQASSWRTHTNS